MFRYHGGIQPLFMKGGFHNQNKSIKNSFCERYINCYEYVNLLQMLKVVNWPNFKLEITIDSDQLHAHSLNHLIYPIPSGSMQSPQTSAAKVLEVSDYQLFVISFTANWKNCHFHS